MNQNHRIWSFIKAKGFYIALALCITGAGTAAWLTAQNTISGIREQQQKPPAVTEQGEGNQWDYEDILQQQTGGEANTPKPSLPTSPSPAPENPAPTQPAAADAPQPPTKSEPAAPLCFCLPVQGAKTIAPFSGGELVKNHTLNVWRTHDGIDLAAEKGTVVTAAEAGTVSAVTMDPMWGGTVAVDHTDGTQTIYCGIAPEKALKAGDRADAGQRRYRHRRGGYGKSPALRRQKGRQIHRPALVAGPGIKAKPRQVHPAGTSVWFSVKRQAAPAAYNISSRPRWKAASAASTGAAPR